MVLKVIRTSIDQHNFLMVDNDQRPPLAPSEKNNDGVASRKPRTREISSRYMHSSSLSTPVPTRHSPFPIIAPNSTLLNPKRGQSVERRLPSDQSLTVKPPFSSQDSNLNNVIIDPKGSSAGRSLDGLWASARSSCESFQADSCNLVNKGEKRVGHPSTTPFTSKQHESFAFPSKAMSKGQDRILRVRNGEPGNNSKASGDSRAKMVDHNCRVGSSVLKGNALSRSLDLSDRSSKAAASLDHILGMRSDSDNKDLNMSVSEAWPMVERNNAKRRMSFDGRTNSQTHGGVMKENMNLVEEDSLSHVSDLSDSLSGLESFSTSSDLNAEEDVGSSRNGGVPNAKGIVVASRFLQTTNSWNHRHQRWRSCTPDRGAPSSILGRSRTPHQGRVLSSNPLERSLSNPSIAGSQSLPSSPIKFITTSPSNNLIFPSRIREEILSKTNSLHAHCIGSSSIPSLVVGARKVNKRLNQLEDAHQLRLLYNRHLQWRFVNAKAHAATAVQTVGAQDLLYNVYAVNWDLRQHMAFKNIEFQKMRRDTSLDLLLKREVPYLEEWSLLEDEHSSCLSGAIDALQSRTIRVPVTEGLRVDLQSSKETLISALKLMQTMDSFIPSLLPKVEMLNSFASELAEIFSQERALIDECGDLLSMVAVMQAQESSYRAHLMQLMKAIDGKEAGLAVQETD